MNLQPTNNQIKTGLFRILASICILTTSFTNINYPDELQTSNLPSLAYILDGDIWIMDVGKAPGKQITETGNYIDFSSSPDGSYLLGLTADENLHLINYVSSNIEDRISEIGKYCDPWVFSLDQAWAPNGQYILVQICTGQYNTYEGFSIIDLEGIVVQSFSYDIRLPLWGNESNELYYFTTGPTTFNRFNLNDLPNEVIFESGTFSSLEALAPVSEIFPASGSPWIAITSQDGPDTPIHHLIFLSGEGEIFRDPHVEYPAHTLAGTTTGLIANPYYWTFLDNWSPDGTQFVYPIEGDPAEQSEYPSIFILDVLTRQRKELWSEGGINPAWSPDGTMIALTTREGGLVVIEVESEVDNNKVRQLLLDAPQTALIEYYASWTSEFQGYFPSREMKPSWSHDGSYLSFTYPDTFFIIDTNSGKEVDRIKGVFPEWITSASSDSLADDQDEKCGTWHVELISSEFIVPRIDVQPIRQNEGNECRGDFLLHNNSGFDFFEGYTFNITKDASNATATWWSEAGSWENRDYLPTFMDIELHILPDEIRNNSEVILEGSYSLGAMAIDLNSYIFNLVFDVSASTLFSCIIPEERLAFEVNYSYIGFLSVLDLIFVENKFLEAVYEFATVAPQYIEYSLRAIGWEMIEECVVELANLDFIDLAWQAVSWIGMYASDLYFVYDAEPIRYRIYYEP